MKKNKRHGGKREGSGRKKKEPTVVKRVPLSKMEEFIELMKAVRTLPIKKSK